MMMTLAERSLAQRRDALQVANRIRSKRAALKRDLKAGRVPVAPLLLDPPDWLRSAKVYDLLLAVPVFGRVKVDTILRVCGVSPAKTVGGLSDRQRTELAGMLGARDTRPLGRGGGRGTRSQYMHALGQANDYRLARAALKHRIAAGETTVAAVLLELAPETEGMTIGGLLMSQDRWGRARTSRFLRGLPSPLRETKTLGSLTERQRVELAARLGEGA